MLKLLIVDDELVIRKGIMMSINWKDVDIEVRDASNGLVALELALEMKPDIVLTDIRMPKMDGIELSKQLRKLLPMTKVIIISGYEDFNYAKEAIANGVSDYLLKPVGEIELFNIICTLKTKILNTKQEIIKRNEISTAFEENKLYLQSKFLWDVVHNKFRDNKYIRDQGNLMGIPLEGPYYQLVIVTIDDFNQLTSDMSEYDIKVKKQKFLKKVNELIGSNTIMLNSNDDYFLMIRNLYLSEENKINLLHNRANDVSKEYSWHTTSFFVSHLFSDVSELANAYKQTKISYSNKFYFENNKIKKYSPYIDVKAVKDVINNCDEEQLLIECVRSGNKEMLRDVIKNIYNTQKNNGFNKKSVLISTTRYLNLSMNIAEDLGVSTTPIPITSYEFSSRLSELETLREITLLLEDSVELIIDRINLYRGNQYSKIVSTVIEYAESHYTEDISLKTLSNIAFVNINYLCRVFKKETGSTFVEWLNKYRIEQAKNILKKMPETKKSDVSSHVGFKDYRYFSTVFKRHTGMSMTEYKKTYL